MKILKSKEGKTEFSKCWLFGCIIFTLVFTIASFVLAAFDKNPVSELSIAIIQAMWPTSGACFLGYNIQNSVRAIASRKENYNGTENSDTSDSWSGDSYNYNSISPCEPETESYRMVEVRGIYGRSRTGEEDGTA